jgi:hypothetical protein
MLPRLRKCKLSKKLFKKKIKRNLTVSSIGHLYYLFFYKILKISSEVVSLTDNLYNPVVLSVKTSFLLYDVRFARVLKNAIKRRDCTAFK